MVTLSVSDSVSKEHYSTLHLSVFVALFEFTTFFHYDFVQASYVDLFPFAFGLSYDIPPAPRFGLVPDHVPELVPLFENSLVALGVGRCFGFPYGSCD